MFSARSPADYATLAHLLRSLPRIPITEAVFDRALAVQGLVARRSRHRSVPLPDLLVAAAAELAGLTVLHYDADDDRIAECTAQPVQWVFPRGTVS